MNNGLEISGANDGRASVALVIPAFNAAATIGETLRSVQSCPGIARIGRVFLCDDASSDDTAAIAMRAWGGLEKLTILRNASNQGERRTINAVIERLRDDFEWVFILHADDVVKENWIDLYLNRMRLAGSNVASICSSYDCWYAEANKIAPGEDDLSRDLEIIRGSRESVLGTLKSGCWWHISGCAIRMQHFFDIGEFHADLPQLGDYEWLLRCLKKGYDIEYIPRTTMFYRLHPKSVSSMSFNRGQDLDERLVILGQYFAEGYLNKTRWRCARICVGYSATRRIFRRLWNGDFKTARRLIAVCYYACCGDRSLKPVAPIH